jgi:hypothetical protein
MDDAGEHRRFRIEMRHLAGDDVRQGRHVRGVLPQLRRHGAVAGRRSHRQLAGDDGARQ